MSTPPNPLDRFRSHSYHHILLVANSTEAMRLLTDPTLSSNQEQEILSSIKLGKKITVNGAGKDSGFFMICDTRKNSFFSINEVTYTSTLSAGATKLSSAIFGTINVNMVDPSGVAFLNYIKWIMDDQLKISLHKAVFLLKTIFVGHTAEGTTETIYQNAIPMMMYDMTLNPSHHGSMIYAKFSPLLNGSVVYIDDYSRMFDVSSIYAKTNSVKDAVASLENKLNEKSREWYKSLQVKIVEDNEQKNIKPSSGYGKLVQYMITIPDDWESFRILGVFDKITESVFGKNGVRGPVTTHGVNIGLKTTPDSTIIDALETILKQSTDVQKLASNEARDEGNVKGYKILTTLTSDDDTVVVHYDIVNYAIPKTQEDSGKKEGKDSIDKTVPFQLKENNQMTFDYIFTGKNTDILNFEMKINNVNLFIADNIVIGDKATTEVNKDQADKSNDGTATKPKELIIKLKEKDPVLPPMKTKSQQENMSWSTETDQKQDAVKARQQFIHNMSLAHGVSSFNVIMKIRGNPNLYQRFSESTIMPHVKIIDSIRDVRYVTTDDRFVNGTNNKYFSDNDVSEYKKSRDLLVKEMGTEITNQATKVPSLLPFYVKVNIKGQDFDVSDQSVEAFNSFKPFTAMWYQGYYMVSKIEHRFINGDFYQEMMLGAIPLDLYGQENSDKNKVEEAKQAEEVNLPIGP